MIIAFPACYFNVAEIADAGPDRPIELVGTFLATPKHVVTVAHDFRSCDGAAVGDSEIDPEKIFTLEASPAQDRCQVPVGYARTSSDRRGGGRSSSRAARRGPSW